MKYSLKKGNLIFQLVAGSFFTVTAMTAFPVFAHDAAAQRIKQLEERLRAIQFELEKVKSESSQAVSGKTFLSVSTVVIN